MARTKQTARGFSQYEKMNRAKSASAPVKKTVAKKKTKRTKPSYKTYLLKLSKVIAPDMHISAQGLAICDDIVRNLVERLAQEADGVRKVSTKKRSTLQERHVEAGIKTMFPSELARHASAEASKAFESYADSLK